MKISLILFLFSRLLLADDFAISECNKGAKKEAGEDCLNFYEVNGQIRNVAGDSLTHYCESIERNVSLTRDSFDCRITYILKPNVSVPSGLSCPKKVQGLDYYQLSRGFQNSPLYKRKDSDVENRHANNLCPTPENPPGGGGIEPFLPNSYPKSGVLK